MQLFVCIICGDPYLGEDKPTNCPFCGAPSKYIVLATDYKEPVIENLSDTSKENLDKALELEIDNSQFYRCASNRSPNLFLAAMFKALSKIEAEHAFTIAKALKITKPVIDPKSNCLNSDGENLKDAYKREDKAIRFYGKAYEEAKEPRVKAIFTALIEIEKDHLKLARETLKKLEQERK
jgi:rubrerythrin